jgi:DNA-binding beta-propeller fold protein YncE
MKSYLAVSIMLLTASFTAHGQQSHQQLPMVHMSGLLKLAETIPLQTEGWMDHLAFDLKTERLFVCAEYNKSLVVVDLKAGKVIHEVKGLSGNPRKPFYLPGTNEIWVDLSDGHVVAVSADTYEQTKVVDLPGHGDPKRVPDNAAYDLAAHLYYAAVSADKGSQGAIEIVDTKAAKYVGSIPLDGIDPGGLAIEPSGKRLYVSMGDVVNGESQVEVIDLEKRAIVAEWPITGGPQAHTASLDVAHHRLFIGSRRQGGHQGEPGALVIINTDTGKVVQALDSVGGADEVQFDKATGRIYFVGTTGTLAVFKQVDPDHYELLGKVPTGAIAKTGLWVPELKRMYVAVPKHIVQTPPYGASDYITEEAHLMVFDYVP